MSDYVVESGASARARARRRRAAITLLAVLLVLFGAFWYAYSYYRNPPAAAATPTATCTTAKQPAKVTVNVYNATGRDGLAASTAEELKARVGGSQIDVVLAPESDVSIAATAIELASGYAPTVDAATRRITAPVVEPVATLSAVLRGLEDVGVTAEDVALRRPTLDEVFLQLTGRPAVEDSASAEVAA